MNNSILEILKTKNIKLTEQQKEAVMHTDGPALVLAVPGSGKTTVIISRIGNLLISKKATADEILAITFSKASATDMTNRFIKVFGNDNLGEVEFSTIHSFCNGVVSKYNRKFRINERLINKKETSYAIKTAYKEATGDILSDDRFETYVSAIGYVKNRLLKDSDIKSYASKKELENFIDILNSYEKFKKDNRLYDFDDMLLKTLYILNKHPVTLNFIRNKYKYILLDEAQDTSLLQYKILKLITNENSNIFLVADDDQSIYNFRGAYSELLLNINEIFPNTKFYFMEQNFRSKKNIISIANSLISNNISRYSKHINTEKDNGDSINIVFAPDGISQVSYLLDNINHNEETAILYRNNISLIMIANHLKQKNIPFYAGNFKLGFFNHWVTHDLLALINLVINRGDVSSFSRIYYKIETYLSSKIIKDLNLYKNKCTSVFDLLHEHPDVQGYHRENLNRIERVLRKVQTMKPHEGLEYMIYTLNYVDFLENRSDSNGVSISQYMQMIDIMIELLKSVNKYENVYNEIQSLNRTLESSKYNTNCNLSLSTLHASKGLEFSSVYILDVNRGILPGIDKDIAEEDDRMDEFEEERRMFYVGITRAKEKLTIISSDEPSCFLDEIAVVPNRIKTIRLKNNK